MRDRGLEWRLHRRRTTCTHRDGTTLLGSACPLECFRSWRRHHPGRVELPGPRHFGTRERCHRRFPITRRRGSLCRPRLLLDHPSALANWRRRCKRVIGSRRSVPRAGRRWTRCALRCRPGRSTATSNCRPIALPIRRPWPARDLAGAVNDLTRVLAGPCAMTTGPPTCGSRSWKTGNPPLKSQRSPSGRGTAVRPWTGTSISSPVSAQPTGGVSCSVFSSRPERHTGGPRVVPRQPGGVG